MVFGKLGDPLRTVTALPVSDYLENANALRGNTYKLEATVAKSLEWSAQGGRLFAVDAAGEVLPLLVPPQLQSVNIERGQRLHFRLEVGEGGLLKVLEVRKA